MIGWGKKLSSWKDKPMSVGGQLALLNSVLTSLTMFILTFLGAKR
jgi:hypothetical protein